LCLSQIDQFISNVILSRKFTEKFKFGKNFNLECLKSKVMQFSLHKRKHLRCATKQ